jgi:Guanylate kinase
MLFDIDVLGALSIKKHFKENSVLIFVKPPSKEEIMTRLINRKTETKQQIERRLSRFDIEMAKINEFDYIVLNDDLESAVNKVQEIINKTI